MQEEWSPNVNFYDKNGKYHLTAEIPGIKKDDISIDIDGKMVTISGKKESEKEEEGADFSVKESEYGYFSRSLQMPTEVEEEKIEAKYRDGVLEVIMPHKKDAKKRKIAIA